jgi:hypothetical protein
MGAITLGYSSRAQDAALRDGPGSTNAFSQASSGDFSVLQIATTNVDKLYADWMKPTAGAYLTTDSQTVRNKPIVIFIIFKGCSSDKLGNCNVTADFETTGPNGNHYDQTRTAEIWVGHPPPPNFNFQLSAAGYGLRIEDKDPIGVYRVRATITDHVSGIVLHTEQSITVAAQ